MGHVHWLLIGLLLPQGLMGWHHLLPFHKGSSSVPYAKGDKKGSTEAPSLRIQRIRAALIMAATQTLPGHFTQLGTFLSKKHYLNRALVLAEFLLKQKTLFERGLGPS